MVALTTVDNPFDPIDDFDNWYAFDLLKGYDSCGLLARIAKTSDTLSDKEYELEVERAIDEIIKYDLEKKFVKIKR
jgi:hypothetical protein